MKADNQMLTREQVFKGLNAVSNRYPSEAPEFRMHSDASSIIDILAEMDYYKLKECDVQRFPAHKIEALQRWLAVLCSETD